MKYILWIVLILFVAALVFFGFLIGQRVDFIQYERHVVSFAAKGIQNGVTAHYEGITVEVNSVNFEVMSSKLLTITERQKIRKISEYDKQIIMTVKVDEENFFIIIPVSKNSKDAYLHTRFDGRNRYFYISDKYRIYERAYSYVQPEGFYGPNKLIEN